jgi:hypothetical protein
MCTCQSCGNKFSVDILVPNELWKLITPKPESLEAGLLCPKCIGERIEKVSDYDAYRLIHI